MKKNNYRILLKLTFISALLVIVFTGCDDNDSDSLGQLYGYASSENAVAQKVNMQIKKGNVLEKKLNFVLRRKATEDIEISYEYDATLIETINAKTNKEYEAYPEELLSLSDETILLPKGSLSSDSLSVFVEYGETLVMGSEYVIPLRAKVKKGDLVIPEKDSYIAFIVKSLGNNTEKLTGIQIFSCMEINHDNPLNHLNFKLKESDKYLFDVVVLFSTNVHYNHKTKKVQISLNEQNKFLFDNIEKYVRPLQNEGIKVIFGLTPHGALDGLANPVGIANLTDDACRAFALELKKFNDFYGLDGLFLDDEYGYNKKDGAGDPSVLHPAWSYEASSRLAYEIKKAMPDKMTAIYTYNTLQKMVDVEGKKPGDFIDYLLPDYGVMSDYTKYFEGVTRDRAGIYSINLSYGQWNLEKNLAKLREEGYKANMVYALKPSGYQQTETLKVLAKELFDDELVIIDKPYQSDWAHLSGEGHKNWSDN